MRKLKYTFKTDTLFKMLFVKNQDLLRKLIAVLMGIPLESIQEFVVRNPDITPEMLGEKFCQLDINMIVNGQLIDLEIQVANEGDYPERVMYYWVGKGVLIVAVRGAGLFHTAAHDCHQHCGFQPVQQCGVLLFLSAAGNHPPYTAV